MACPYFYPEVKWDGKLAGSAPQFPLGDFYQGTCRAGATEFRPDWDRLRKCCNMGYARPQCPRFPADAGPDAVRFTIVRDRQGAIDLYYAIEKNHSPYEHGPFEYDRETRALSSTPANAALGSQARAYVESYLRRILSRAATA